MLNVNYSEYNERILPNSDLLSSFFACLDHAIQKTGHYDEVMHQLKCIGLSERLVNVANEAAKLYKTHHRARIEAEQGRKNSIAEGDVLYSIVMETKTAGAIYPSISVVETNASEDLAKQRLLDIWRTNMTRFICDEWQSFDGKPLTIDNINGVCVVCMRDNPGEAYLRMHIVENKLF